MIMSPYKKVFMEYAILLVHGYNEHDPRLPQPHDVIITISICVWFIPMGHEIVVTKESCCNIKKSLQLLVAIAGTKPMRILKTCSNSKTLLPPKYKCCMMYRVGIAMPFNLTLHLEPLYWPSTLTLYLDPLPGTFTLTLYFHSLTWLFTLTL